MFTDFIVVRHGETPYNKTRIIQGWYDIPLNETGYLQAETTADALREDHFDEAWFSDLQRASETAKKILEFHPEVSCFPCEQLREWKLGILQNKSHTEIEAEMPQFSEMFRNESMDIPIPDGESRSEFGKRVRNIFQELADRAPGKRLLVVTHGGVLGRLHRFIQNEAPAIPAENASVTRVRYDHETKKWSIPVWNQTFSIKTLAPDAPPAL